MKIQEQIIKTVLENLNFINDPDKIIVTIDDLKYIPDLSKIISIEKIVKNKEITLSQLNYEKRLEVVFLFLKKYYFIQKFGKYYYFDYKKMLDFWPNLEYYKEIFKKLKPELSISIKNENHDFYKWDDLAGHDKMYIGFMFFSAFNKIKNNFYPNDKEYDYFTDIGLSIENMNMIDNFKNFFLKEFMIFINTDYGSVFGDYQFGSNLKKYIQTKDSVLVFDKIKLDIIGFINDLSVLYSGAITFKDLIIEQTYSFSYKITVVVSINNEVISLEINQN